MKTSALTDRALDYAVALADNHPIWVPDIGVVFTANTYRDYRPTTGPAGDDIIDREKISTSWSGKSWEAFLQGPTILAEFMVHWALGATRREAAMRCYVQYKLGADVEIPKELM